MAFIADDLAAWLVSLLADAGRKKLSGLVLGDEQERALRHAATAAIRSTVGELRPEGGEPTKELEIIVSHVFAEPAPDRSSTVRATLMETLQAGVARQLAVLDDAGLTGAGQSSAEILGLPTAVVGEKLTGYLVREIVLRGSRGGPLEPLAAQLNHDATHLQGKRLEDLIGRLAGEIRDALARLDTGQPLPPASPVAFTLPTDTAAFTDRSEQLDQISVAAVAAAGAGRVVAIHVIDGMPGVGKTTLAVHAGHMVADLFPSRQLFVDLHAHTPGRQPADPADVLGALLAADGVDPRYLPRELDGRAAMWRDRMSGKRVLLILDNAASSAQVAPLLPGSAGCLVMVTSRRYLGDLPSALVPVPLETLSPGDAMTMFMKLAPRAGQQPEKVTQMVTLCGYLPLAISLLASVFNRHRAWSIDDLMDETKAKLLIVRAENRTVAAAFELSYQYLPARQQRFFRYLGLYPGDDIDSHAAAALTGLPLEETAGLLDELHRVRFLTESFPHRYRMHNLIREYARSLAAVDGFSDEPMSKDSALGRLFDYYEYTAEAADIHLVRYTRPAASKKARRTPVATPALTGRDQARAWMTAERANLLACVEHAAKHHEWARVVGLTAAIAAHLLSDGPWPQAIALHTAAVGAARQMGDRPGEASALNCLGVVLHVTGDNSGAAAALRQALDISLSIGDRLGEANALIYLGSIRYLTGDYEGAITILDRALDLYLDLGDRLGEAMALNQLGFARYLSDEFPGAVNVLERALHVCHDLGDRLGEANALISLGAVRHASCDLPGAIAVLEQALNVTRELGNRLGEANALIFLGCVRQLTGDYPGSISALEQALTLYEYLGDRLGEAHAFNELGVVRCLAGDYARAAVMLEQALDTCRALDDRLGEANALKDLGRVRQKTGDNTGSALVLQQALGIYRALHDRCGEGQVLSVTGALHLACDDAEQAQVCYQGALELFRATGSRLDEAEALEGIAKCVRVLRTADANSYLQKALEIYQSLNSPEASRLDAEIDASA